MRIIIALFILTSVLMSSTGHAKKVVYRKTQKIDFNETDIDGQVRSPDGAYLVQKRGVEFMPLYKVKERIDEDIQRSIEYLE